MTVEVMAHFLYSRVWYARLGVMSSITRGISRSQRASSREHSTSAMTSADPRTRCNVWYETTFDESLCSETSKCLIPSSTTAAWRSRSVASSSLLSSHCRRRPIRFFMGSPAISHPTNSSQSSSRSSSVHSFCTSTIINSTPASATKQAARETSEGSASRALRRQTFTFDPWDCPAEHKESGESHWSLGKSTSKSMEAASVDSKIPSTGVYTESEGHVFRVSKVVRNSSIDIFVGRVAEARPFTWNRQSFPLDSSGISPCTITKLEYVTWTPD
mmetsp:Transcript_49568/g.98006  ORF Transcript_49568/g.98006 Transcript_49568/m.98006 type:complete len:273 (+) Transcript_49568:156-974(+)